MAHNTTNKTRTIKTLFFSAIILLFFSLFAVLFITPPVNAAYIDLIADSYCTGSPHASNYQVVGSTGGSDYSGRWHYNISSIPSGRGIINATLYSNIYTDTNGIIVTHNLTVGNATSFSCSMSNGTSILKSWTFSGTQIISNDVTSTVTDWYNGVSNPGFVIYPQHISGGSNGKIYENPPHGSISKLRVYYTDLYNNTGVNDIVFSQTSNYNISISTLDVNNSFYVTTWIDNATWNSGWSWYGILLGTDFYLETFYPNGGTTTQGNIYNQNANQKLINLSYMYPVTGTYTFKIMRFFNDTPVFTNSITLTNSTGSTNNTYPPFIGFSNNAPPDPNVIITYNYSGNSVILLDGHNYNFILGSNWGLYPTTGLDSPFGLNSGQQMGNGTLSIVNDLTYWRTPLLLRARLFSQSQCSGVNCGTATALATDYHYFNPLNYTPTPTPTPTLPPTPIPTLSPTPTPTATFSPTPTYTPNPTITFTPQPTDSNYSSYNGSGMGNLNDFGNVSTNNINNINNNTISVSNQISSYDYSTSKSVFGYFLPAIFNMIPPKLWGIIILGWAMEVSLILLRR